MAEAEKKAKAKRPTPLKRNLQDAKKRLRNRAMNSRVKTAMFTFQQAVEGNKAEEIKSQLSAAHSLIDKALKIGLYKKNKAQRLKSQLAQRAK